MILETLRISAIPSYLPGAGNYEGEIVYRSERGKIQLNLTHDQVARILPVVADALVESSKEVAYNLTASVITVGLALEVHHD
jgi:hypothetical protein